MAKVARSILKVKLMSRFKSVMKPYRLLSRSSTVSNAFAQALSPADDFDEAKLIEAFENLALVGEKGLLCLYCGKGATSVDHLNPLVKDSKFTGWGHVLGNLVPACNECNQSKGGRPWRDFVAEMGMSEEQIRRVSTYESQAPTPVSQDDLAQFYPDLNEAYQRLRELSIDTLRAAQSLANEIQRLELDRKSRDSGRTS
jgi:5-methylcytosine-specific restriction endonuclease McrA